VIEWKEARVGRNLPFSGGRNPERVLQSDICGSIPKPRVVSLKSGRGWEFEAGSATTLDNDGLDESLKDGLIAGLISLILCGFEGTVNPPFGRFEGAVLG
jgi:hypothetical protein